MATKKGTGEIQPAVLFILRQKSGRGKKAHRRTIGVYL